MYNIARFLLLTIASEGSANLYDKGDYKMVTYTGKVHTMDWLKN